MLPLGHLAVQVLVLPEQRVRESLACEMACGIVPIQLLHVRDQTAVTNVAFWHDGRQQRSHRRTSRQRDEGPAPKLRSLMHLYY
jgi:hypothetical protein